MARGTNCATHQHTRPTRAERTVKLRFFRNGSESFVLAVVGGEDEGRGGIAIEGKFTETVRSGMEKCDLYSIPGCSGIWKTFIGEV